MGNGKVVEDDELDDGIVIDDNGGEGLTFKRLTGAASAALAVAEGAADAALRSCKGAAEAALLSLCRAAVAALGLRAADAALEDGVTLTGALLGKALMLFAVLIMSRRSFRSSRRSPRSLCTWVERGPLWRFGLGCGGRCQGGVGLPDMVVWARGTQGSHT